MENKKLGLIIIGLSILFGLLLLAYTSETKQIKAAICSEHVNTCDATHESSFLTHTGIAVVFITLSLGIYLLFFERSHQILIEKLKTDASIKSKEEKFNLILMGLNNDEKMIMNAIKNQEGITQHTLGIRTNFHKSKLSVIISILEEKGLIKKEKKGKNNYIFLRIQL
jgi:uncharacterized membrane protein